MLFLLHTFDIITFALAQDLSFGTFPLWVTIRTITAAVTFTTAPGGEPNDFNSVKLDLLSVFNASWAAIKAGSAFFKSSAQSLCLMDTSLLISLTLIFSLSAVAFSFDTFSVSIPTTSINLSASSFFLVSSISCLASCSFSSSTYSI